MRAGDICLARFPFGDAPGMKLRPVLVMTSPVGPVPEVLVAYISSVVPAFPLASDLLLDPRDAACDGTNLKVPSVLRLHKLATIHVSSVERHLGRLPPTMEGDVERKLRELLQL